MIKTIFILITAILIIPHVSGDYIDTRSVAINSYNHLNKFDIYTMTKKKMPCDQNAEALNLDKMGLKKIKKNIIYSDAIHDVSLQENELTYIPDNIFKQVPYLKCLNISGNKINIYNKNKFEHENLRILDLSNQDLPNVFNHLSEIDDEETSKNIYSFMVFNNTDMYLPNLEHLFLGHNEVATLALDFKNSFPRLISIYLNNIKAVKLDPMFFNKIPMSLRILHLESNNLRNLTLTSMADVSELYLDNNPLLSINISSTKLKVLSLSNCMELGQGSLDTPNLEYFDISRNYYHTVDSIHFEILPFLSTIILDYNALEEIPLLKGSKLMTLSINYNKITKIRQNSFHYLTSLQKLLLKGNKITSIDNEAFVGLKTLQYLDLSLNDFKILPDKWMLSLINLRYLNLSSNQFANIYDLTIDPTSSIQHLFVKNNLFTKLTMTELMTLPYSVTVYLA